MSQNSQRQGTLPPDDPIFSPNTVEEQYVDTSDVWGRLLPTLNVLSPYDLRKYRFTLGRSSENDCYLSPVYCSDKLNKYIRQISNNHFTITRTEEPTMTYITDTSTHGTFVDGNLIGKGCTAILDNHSQISIGSEKLKIFIYKDLQVYDDNFLSEKLAKKYDLSRKLGNGSYGEVRMVFNKLDCKEYAVKRIDKKESSNRERMIRKEIEILQTVSHPFIVRLIEVDETSDCFLIVMEYMNGGELTEEIYSDIPMGEEHIKFLFRELTLSVQYLHSLRIIHRDLKPANILLKKGRIDTIAKVSDFGLSKIMEGSAAYTDCGTPYFKAPEVLWHAKYTYQADIWSLGVILYLMLAKELPFKATTTDELMWATLYDVLDMNTSTWDNVSEEAKDLVKSMLEPNPKERIKLDDIMQHPWLDSAVKEKVDAVIRDSQSSSQYSGE